MLSCLPTPRVGIATVLISVAAIALGTAPASAGAAAPASPSSTTVLEQGTGLGGAPSRAVRRVQQTLAHRGYHLGRPGVDGRFGPLTAAAVRRLQTRYGLVPDGVVGPKTRRVLALLDAARASDRRRDRPRSTRATPTPPRAQRPASPAVDRPAPPVETRAADRSDITAALAVAALAAVLAAAALGAALTRRRQRDAIAVASIDRDLYLEGESASPDIGAFRGYALATAVAGGRRTDTRHASYLVDDPRKPAPIWVEGTDIRRSPAQLARGGRVIGYVTAGTDPGVEQRALMAIEDACDDAGWRLEDIIRDRDTGRMVGRPGLTGALERIAAGDAQGLVTSDVRTLARSLPELGGLLEVVP